MTSGWTPGGEPLQSTPELLTAFCLIAFATGKCESRRLPGITQRAFQPNVCILESSRRANDRTAICRNVPGSRLLPTHRAAI